MYLPDSHSYTLLTTHSLILFRDEDRVVGPVPPVMVEVAATRGEPKALNGGFFPDY